MPSGPGKQRDGRQSDLGAHGDRRLCFEFPLLRVSPEQNRTWAVFREGNPYASWPLGILMGFLWFAGVVFYGTGAASLGSLGNIVGWPIFIDARHYRGSVLGRNVGRMEEGKSPGIALTTGLESESCWWQSRSSPQCNAT